MRAKSYTLPLSRDNFKDDIVYYPGSKLHSEQIINNKLGEKVTAVLTVDDGITKIKLCDVIGQKTAKFFFKQRRHLYYDKNGRICL